MEQWEDLNDRRGFHHWLNLYMERCPAGVRSGETTLFLQPLKNPKSSIWYSAKKPVGERSFTNIIKKCYETANLTGDFTLRSIRASNVTELTNKNVDAEVIKSRTGHCSDRALAQYKRPRAKKEAMRVSKLLINPAPSPREKISSWITEKCFSIEGVLLVAVLMLLVAVLIKM